MKSLKSISSDAVVLGVSTLIITTCSVLLYAEFTARLASGGEKRIGTISFKREVAQRKYSAQVLWEEVEQNAPVYNNDAIRTANLSEAVVRLQDGTSINLEENSLIVLAMSENAINVNFQTGSISANREGVKDGAGVSSLKIETPEATVTLGKADVKIAKGDKKEIDMVVTEGDVEILANGERRKIRKDEKAQVGEGRKTSVVKLSLRQNEPRENAIVVTAGATAPVSFTWEPVSGDQPVTVEVSRDRGFRAPVTNVVPRGNRTVMNLPEGGHYWRIKAANLKTGVAEFSDTRSLTVLRDDAIRLLLPADGEAAPFTARLPIINFQWAKNKLAASYVLEVAADQAFAKILRTIDTPQTSIAIDDLNEGAYWWRVRTRVSANIATYEGQSAPRRLVVRREAVLRAPLLIEPAPGKRVSAALIERGRFAYSWQADPQAAGYEFSIARNSDFKDPVVKSAVRGNFLTATPLAPGDYFWRVGAVVPGRPIVYSESRQLSVMPVDRIVLAEPAVVATAGAGAQRNATVRFSWNKGTLPGRYQLEIARDRTFTALVTRELSEATSVTVPSLGAGLYFWRVRLLDADRSQITESELAVVNLTEKGTSEPVRGEDAEALAAELAREKAEAERRVAEVARLEREQKQREEQERARQRLEAERKDREEKEAARREQEKKDREARDLAKKEKDAKDAEQAQKDAREREEAKKQKDEEKRQQELARQQELQRQQEEKRQQELARQQDQKRLQEEKRQQELARQQELKRQQEEKRQQELARQQELKRQQEEKRQQEQARQQEPKPVVVKPIVAKRGTVRWTARLASAILSKPIISNEIIVVTTKRGTAVGVDRAGRQRWQTPLGGPARSTPVADATSIYIVNVNSQLLCLDVFTGRINWRAMVEGPLLFGAQPVVVNGVVYVATSFGAIQAFGEGGKQLWSRNLDEGIFSSLTHQDGLLFVGTDKARVYALNAKNGSIEWDRRTDGRVFTATPRVSGDMLYVGCYSGTFYALNTKNGSVRWTYKAEKPILSSAVVLGDIVFFGTEGGRIHGLSRIEGKEVWSFQSPGRIDADPDALGDYLFMPSGRSVFSFKLSTGEIAWKQDFPVDISTAVSIIGNEIVVGLDNGDLVSLVANVIM